MGLQAGTLVRYQKAKARFSYDRNGTPQREIHTTLQTAIITATPRKRGGLFKLMDLRGKRLPSVLERNFERNAEPILRFNCFWQAGHLREASTLNYWKQGKPDYIDELCELPLKDWKPTRPEDLEEARMFAR